MRIGLVCPYDLGSPGGVQQITGELADHLRLLGDEVVSVAAGKYAYDGGPGYDEGILPVGRPTRIRANESTVPLTLAPTAWWRVRDALEDVDVIHIHEPFIPLVGWAALTVDRPTVATFHADAPGWVETLYRWIPLIGHRMRRAVLTAVSESASEAIPGSWGQVHLVPNALDVSSYDVPVGRIDRRVAFLGRDDPRKGLDVLLRAWPAIMKGVPDAELVVMGADRGLELQGVKFVGRVSGGEKRRLLATSGIFVAPNLGGESFGIVVLEGMAAGCAVVASSLEPFTSVLGDAGLTFPVGDSATLAEEVVGLLLDPERTRRLGDRARQHSRRFDWAKVVTQYRALYETALT